MAKTMKLEDCEFTKHDVLECEIDVIPMTLVTNFKQDPVRNGKQKLEILGEAIHLFMEQYVQSEEEKELIKSLTLDFNNKKKRLEARLAKELEENKINEDQMIEQIEDFVRSNNQWKSFWEMEQRDPKPIRSLRVIENKGPRATDLQAKSNQDRELMSTMLELMKQNQEVFKNLLNKPAAK